MAKNKSSNKKIEASKDNSTTKTQWSFGHPCHPSTKLVVPKISLPKYISINPNRYYRKMMAIALANKVKRPSSYKTNEDKDI